MGKTLLSERYENMMVEWVWLVQQTSQQCAARSRGTESPHTVPIVRVCGPHVCFNLVRRSKTTGDTTVYILAPAEAFAVETTYGVTSYHAVREELITKLIPGQPVSEKSF